MTPPPTLSSVSFVNARNDLAQLCSRVQFGTERIVLTRHGKAGAALVSMADLERLRSTDLGTQTRDRSRTSIDSALAPVWNAIVLRHLRCQWFGFPFVEFHADEGEAVLFDSDTKPGAVLEVEPGKVLRIEWSGGRGEVEIRTESAGDVTTVTVVHSMAADFWDERLEQLRLYIEAQS